MALLAELLWDNSTGLVYDSVSDISGEVTTNSNRRELYDREIRGQSYTVMSQPHPYLSNRAYDRINLSSVLSSYTTWTIEFLMRIPRPESRGAILTFTGNNAHWRIWDGEIDDGQSSIGFPCPDNRWVVVTIRCNGSVCQMYYDNVFQGVLSVRSLDFLNYINIGAFSVSYHSNTEIARVRIWDEYLDITGNTSINSDWQSDDTISGSFCMEEEDSGEQSLVELTSDNSVSISFPGVVCWGCLMAPIRNSYDLRSTINRDPFILGTGHISTNLQLLSTFRGGSRSNPCAIISATMDSDYLTVLNVRARLYDSSGNLLFSHIFESGFNPNIDYTIRLGRNNTSYYFMYDGEEVAYLCDVISTEDLFMMGLNLGPHYGSPSDRWEIRYSNIKINQTPAIPEGTEAEPDDIESSWLLGSPAVSVAVSAAPSDIVTPWELGSPAVAVESAATPEAIASSWELDSPSVSIAVTVTPDDIEAMWVLGMPSASIGTMAEPEDVAGQWVFGGPAVSVECDAVPEDIGAPWWLGSPRVNYDEVTVESVVMSTPLIREAVMSTPLVREAIMSTPLNVVRRGQ